MSQSRRMSMAESAANVAIGYLVALGGQMVVFPLVGLTVDLETNLVIGAAFTVISIARSYCVRRLFNRWHHHASR
jgi:hypothetical protein